MNKTDLRVLSVFTCFPFPAVSGTQIRIAGILRLIRQLGCRSHVLYFLNKEQGAIDRKSPEMSSLCEEVTCAGFRREQSEFKVHELVLHKMDFFIRGAMGIPGKRYPFSMRYDAVAADRSILAEGKRVGADVVLPPPQFVHYADLLIGEGMKVIADAYDVLSEITSSLVESHRREGWIKRLGLYSNYLACRGQERIFLPRCSEIWATSRTEAEAFSRIAPNIPVLVVPNCLEEERVRPAPSGSLGRHVGFIGLYSYQPNLEAAIFLAEKIFPVVLARCPNARLRLAGGGMPKPVEQRLKILPNVDVLGKVPDSGKFMDDCAVLALPMFVRGGVPLKLVEAMARGKAVVTTSGMVNGLPVRDGVDLLIRNGAEDFALAVTELMHSPDGAMRLGENARATFLEHWSMTAALKTLRQRSILSGLVAGS